MKISKLLAGFCFAFAFSHAFAADDVDQRTTETTTQTPEGTTTTRTTEDYDHDRGPGAGGFFFEPGIRYDKISGNVHYPGPLGTSNVDADGVGVDMRLGFHIMDVMFIAAEGNYTQMHVSEGSTDYAADGGAYSYGPTLGFQTPWAGIRLWGTYLAGGQFDPGSHNGFDLKFTDLTGYKVGLGFRIAKVGISVEYLDAKYDNVEVQKAGPFTGIDTNLNLNHTGWLGEISFPISL